MKELCSSKNRSRSLAVMLFTCLALLHSAFAQTSNSTMPPFPKTWIATESNGRTYLYRNPPPGQSTAGNTPLKLEIVELDSDRPYFHWGKKEEAARWQANGGKGLSDTEFALLRSNGDGQAAGGGFYISKDFTNSSSYGPHCMSIRLRKKVRVVLGNPSPFFPDLLHSQWSSLALESYGLDGIAYSMLETGGWWINLYKPELIESITATRFDDLISTANLNYQSISGWTGLLRKADLDPELNPFNHLEEAGKRFPFFKRAALQQLTEADRAELWSVFSQNGLLSSYLYFFPVVSPDQIQKKDPDYFQAITQAMKQVPEASAGVKALQSVMTPLILEKLNLAKERANYFSYLETYQKLSALLPLKLPTFVADPITKNFTHLLPWTLQKTDLTNTNQVNSTLIPNDFIIRYFRSFAFINLADRLNAQSQAVPNPSLWTLHDQEGSRLYDHWYQLRFESAEKKINAGRFYFPNKNAEDLLFYPYPEDYQEARNSIENLCKIASRLSGGKTNSQREESLIAGGEHLVNGVSYYQVTRKQLSVLENNPYLKIESIEDPNEKPGSATLLARHEYPSARTYQKFKKKLSATLLQDLTLAETKGSLQNLDSPEFKSLTKRIIEELWLSLKTERIFNPLDFYQRAVSIHPFLNENGLVLRFLYSLGNGRPLILRNWDWDIMMSLEELHYEAALGEQFFTILGNELSHIYQTSPEFPKVYDAKSPYAFFLDQGNLEQVAHPDYLQQARETILNPNALRKIRQKIVLESGSFESDPCSRLLGGKLKN